MLRTVPADDAAYILGVLPEETAQNILPLMKAEDSQEVANLMAYPKGTAGSIMTTEFFSLPEDTSAREAIQLLQQATKAETVFYIYPTDRDGRLTGVVSLRELLVIAPTAPLNSILTRDVISVTVDTDQKEVAHQVANTISWPFPSLTAIIGWSGLLPWTTWWTSFEMKTRKTC